MRSAALTTSLLAGALLLLPACSQLPKAPAAQANSAQQARPAPQERSFTILSINDVYRLNGLDNGERGGLPRVRALRQRLEKESPDLLMLHAGDFLAPSLLSRGFYGEQMVDLLNQLDGDASGFDHRMFVTFGNHEFDRDKARDAATLQDRIRESQFNWLSANVTFKTGADGQPVVAADNLMPSAIVTSGGVKVGIFGLTLNEKVPAYVEGIDSCYAKEAVRQTRLLRDQGAEVVVALTHLPLEEDEGLVEALGPAGPDLILGGHEHQRQAVPVVNPRVFKADADAVTAVVVRVKVKADGSVRVEGSFERLAGNDPAPDAGMVARAKKWDEEYGGIFCNGKSLPLDCLDDVLGRSQTQLIAEELEIRRFETNFGDWVADRMVEEFAGKGAQGAFINSGSLRLNQNLAAGPIRRRDIEELFAYPTKLRLIEITGATLQQVVSRAVENWKGRGHWLQVSGFAFRHDPGTTTATGLTLLTGPGSPRPVRPDETLRLVTTDYLLDPKQGDQDGYAMLHLNQVKEEGSRDLKDVVIAALDQAEPQGIAPVLEGRICNPSERPDAPCLLQPAAQTTQAALGMPVHTYSIVARDPITGDLGVAVQSHWFQVGSVVAWAEAGVGAVATQSFVEVSYGPLGLEKMAAGQSPQQALDQLLAADAQRDVRQVAMVDAQGRVAAWTGPRCIAAAGHHTGEGYSVQANLMDRAEVWPAMAHAYETSEGDLADRLLAALEGAQAAGGDIRGSQSAALLVVRGKSTGPAWQDRLVDLRVDDNPQPLVELRRLLTLHRAYDAMNRGDEAMALGKVEEAVPLYARAAELAPQIEELPFWQAVTLFSTGQEEPALAIFRRVFAADTRWARLVPRLPAAGLLPDDPEKLARILAQAPGQEAPKAP